MFLFLVLLFFCLIFFKNCLEMNEMKNGTVTLNLINYVPYVLSCLACLVPYLLSYLTCPCPTCSRALIALMPHVPCALRAFVPYVPRALRVLVPHVSRALRALVPHVSRALLVFCLTCLVSYVPRAKRTVVSHVFYVLLYLPRLVPCVFSGCSCLELFVLVCSSSLTCFKGLKPKCSYASHVCSFHALCLLCFGCFSCLSFLQSGLRLIIEIDTNKDTLNMNNINTLYPLRVVTYVKNEFQNLLTGFKSNRRRLGYV